MLARTPTFSPQRTGPRLLVRPGAVPASKEAAIREAAGLLPPPAASRGTTARRPTSWSLSRRSRIRTSPRRIWDGARLEQLRTTGSEADIVAAPAPPRICASASTGPSIVRPSSGLGEFLRQ